MVRTLPKVLLLGLVLLGTGAQAQGRGEGGSPVGAGRVGLQALFSGPRALFPGVGTVGIKAFLTDSVALTVDAGVGVAVPRGGGAVGFGVGVGGDFYLRQGALRPFLTGGLLFGRDAAPDAGWGFGLDVGGGAEYFFNPNVSVSIRALLPFIYSNVGQPTSRFDFGTVTPGVGLTLFF